MKKQELIKKYEDLFEKLYAFPIVTINGVIEDFKQLDGFGWVFDCTGIEIEEAAE